jgi:carbon-monoxide dehydrogenase large subunit
VGRIINPQIVDREMHGAIVQGISNACFEQFVYDANGQQLTADFENYKLATAADVPDIKVMHEPTPCPHTPLGSRGIGEGRPSAVPGTLANAICDALRPFGVEITELPLRPDRIWRLLQEAQRTPAAGIARLSRGRAGGCAPRQHRGRSATGGRSLPRCRGRSQASRRR